MLGCAMLYLMLAICCSALVSILMRVSERYVRNTMAMFSTSYAVCTVLSLLYARGLDVAGHGEGAPYAIVLGAVAGVLYLAGFVLLQKNVSRNGVILSGTAMKLGNVLIPVAVAALLFGERLGWLQLAGVVLAIAAIVLINMQKGATAEGGGVQRSWLGALLLVCGAASAMVNIYDKTGAAELKDLYLCCTFFVAMLVAVALAIHGRKGIAPADVLFGLLIGIPNCHATRFLMLSLAQVPASIAYPVFSTGAIVVISVAGIALFRERLDGRKIAALAMIAVSLVLLNL